MAVEARKSITELTEATDVLFEPAADLATIQRINKLALETLLGSPEFLLNLKPRANPYIREKLLEAAKGVPLLFAMNIEQLPLLAKWEQPEWLVHKLFANTFVTLDHIIQATCIEELWYEPTGQETFYNRSLAPVVLCLRERDMSILLNSISHPLELQSALFEKCKTLVFGGPYTREIQHLFLQKVKNVDVSSCCTVS